MRHVYECPNCRVIGDPRITRADAVSDRTAHRDRAHHGLAPSGLGHGPADSIQAVPGMLGQLARGAFADLAAAGQRRQHAKARAASAANARAERLATIAFFAVLVVVLVVITR
ncbi:hypothetical protein VSR01_16370 [Actinacidiphila sp. DG2A-62]|uniref:hypothetical protein n=1 Tax=Actinacidiphila sp. DG2A-62 TaxID=3108821 RepID=UPI002DBB0049|nr:hypothetical protein [Actinacidiphila sp. DG2A-62]MEC3995021.1 hypothetical protein [Actinacidiphila sp. DG2A-62]